MQMLFKIIGFFILQTMFEALIMSILAKIGIPYMDIDATGEGIIEVILGIVYYYSLSKALIVILPYIILMFLGYAYGSKIFSNLNRPHIMNIVVSILLTVVFWIYFENPFKELLNPVLGTLIAAVCIFFISTIIQKSPSKSSVGTEIF